MSRTDTRPKPATRTWLILVLIVLVGAGVFVPALHGDWIYDDKPLIAQNPYVHSFHWFTRWFTTDFWDVNEELVRFGGRMIYWRPVVTLTYALDWHLGAGNPLTFHITNTILQCAVAALSFIVLRRWIGAVWPAVLATLLFAVHPTKAESVAWIAGRTDVMCMIGVLLASQGIGLRLRGQHASGVLLEAVGTVFAYTTKEQAIVLPALAAIEAWVSLGRPALDRAALKRLVVVSIPQAAIAVGYLAIRAIVMPISAAVMNKPLGFLPHSEAILETMGRFVALTFAPHELSIQHALMYTRHGEYLFSTPYVILGAIAVSVLLAIALAARKRWPAATVGIGFYLFTLLPTSNLKYTEMATLVSERFLYLPIFGIAAVAGWGLASLHGPWLKRGYALATTCIVALSMIAMSRAADFTNEREFWQRELRLHSNSREAHTVLIAHAIADKQFNSALRTLESLKRLQDAYDRRGSWDLSIAYEASHILRYVIRDHDKGALTALDTFIHDVLARDKPIVELSVHGAVLRVPTEGNLYRAQLDVYRAQFLALRADINSRLGNDPAALSLGLQARLVCSRCVTVVVLDALAYARAGNYGEAERVLDSVSAEVQETPIEGVRQMIQKARQAHDVALRSTGPAQLQAHASELAALELWGRAYDVLAPYAEEIKRAPRFALGFAEVAFRAGETAAARDVLAATVPPQEIEARLNEWSAAMGWTE